MGFLDFLDNVGNLFGELASLISALFAILWSAMVTLFTFLWNTLVLVFNFLVSVFQNVAKFFARAWTDYIKPAINGLFNIVGRIFSALHRLVAPLMRWIQKIRAWYDTHILPILMKQIQMIQRIRQFLAVLRIFHVKWAQLLDDKLAAMQGKIVQSIEIVRQKLNEIINFFAIVSDPKLLLGSLPHATWLVKFLDTTLRALGGIGLGWFIGYKNRTGISAGKTLPFDAITDQMKEDTHNGTGEFAKIRSQATYGVVALDSELR